MLNIKDLNKTMIAIATMILLGLSAGVSFAEQSPDTMITAVDPNTGRVVEASKLLSEMTEEEKAAYSEEDLKILEAHEAEMSKEIEMPKY